MARNFHLELENGRYILRIAQPHEASLLAGYVRANARHLWEYEPARPDALNPAWWTAQLLANPAHERRWVLFEGTRPVGQVSILEVVRGAAHQASLSYALATSHVGRGLLTRLLPRVIDHAFGSMGLHRLRAHHHPDNDRSARLLDRLDFQIEGLAKKMLFVNGTWTDRVLRAHINPAPLVPPFQVRLTASGLEPVDG